MKNRRESEKRFILYRNINDFVRRNGPNLDFDKILLACQSEGAYLKKSTVVLKRIWNSDVRNKNPEIYRNVMAGTWDGQFKYQFNL